MPAGRPRTRGVYEHTARSIGERDKRLVRIMSVARRPQMAAKYQITIDCKDPARMSAFWVAALGYEIEPPPKGFSSWEDYWRDVGVPEDELGVGPDRIFDPTGGAPRIWFQVVDEPKTLKNRLHFDINASGGRSVPLEERKKRVEAEADRLVRAGAKRLRTLFEEGLDHYGVAMADPEGNEFDIN